MTVNTFETRRRETRRRDTQSDDNSAFRGHTPPTPVTVDTFETRGQQASAKATTILCFATRTPRPPGLLTLLRGFESKKVGFYHSLITLLTAESDTRERLRTLCARFADACERLRTLADACGRLQTLADTCRRLRTLADACGRLWTLRPDFASTP